MTAGDDPTRPTGATDDLADPPAKGAEGTSDEERALMAHAGDRRGFGGGGARPCRPNGAIGRVRSNAPTTRPAC